MRIRLEHQDIMDVLAHFRPYIIKKFTVTILSLVVVLSIPMYAQRGVPGGQNEYVETLRSLIERGAVTRVLIFHVNDSTMTRVSLTPKALLSMASSSLRISADIKRRLNPVFLGMSFEKQIQTPDLRWGAYFMRSQPQDRIDFRRQVWPARIRE